MRTRAPLVGLLLLAGCALPPETVRRPDPVVARIIADAAAQVKRCYRTPRVTSAGRQIVSVLRVSYAPDGTLSGLPELIAQRGVTDANRDEALRMAEAASLAIIRCSPVRLPPDRYTDGWSSFELTFSPRAVA